MNTTSKLSMNIFKEMFTWTFWFIITVFIIHIALTFLIDPLSVHFISFSYQASQIYMLVIGIIAASAYLPIALKHGVTRKQYFNGSMLASIYITLLMSVSLIVLNDFQHLVLPAISASFDFTVFSFSQPMLILDASLNNFVYFLLGWFISISFYRNVLYLGSASILISLVFMALLNALWLPEYNRAIISWLPLQLDHTYPGISTFVTIVIIAIILLLNRLLTKRIAVKPA